MAHPLVIPDRAEANRRFGEVFQALTQASVDTNSFLRFSSMAVPAAKAALDSQFTSLIAELLATGEFEEFFAPQDLALQSLGGVTGMVDDMTTRSLVGYERVVGSAAIVLAHSALDGAVSDLCWVTALASPEAWEPFVEEKTVPLKEVKKTTYEELRTAKLVDHLTKFEREPLLKRTDRLFAVCQPPSGWESPQGYRFDRERLEALDRLRQDIVHHSVAEAQLASVKDDVEFMIKTGLHLWSLPNRAFDVKIDVRNLVRLPKDLTADGEESAGGPEGSSPGAP